MCARISTCPLYLFCVGYILRRNLHKEKCATSVCYHYFSCFRKSCTMDAMFVDALSSSNLTLAKRTYLFCFRRIFVVRNFAFLQQEKGLVLSKPPYIHLAFRLLNFLKVKKLSGRNLFNANSSILQYSSVSIAYLKGQ